MKATSFLFRIFILLSGTFFINNSISGQITIRLDNASFEDTPRLGQNWTPSIRSWHDCGFAQFPRETPPDINSASSKYWNVNLDPYHGETYLGLVIRYNDTYESVSQELEHILKKEKCYSFSMFLARSDTYLSMTSRATSTPENFISPVVLRIWGGNEKCDREELLGLSDPVDHSTWKQYDFLLWPTKDHTHITIEAFYADPDKPAYNGHVMVDNLSMIYEIDCK